MTSSPSQPDDRAALPLHVFTIVLNGEPFIRAHITMLQQLPLRWHWHIVEGVAALVNDTAWSLDLGGHIPDDLHNQGLSCDGTTAYLDTLAAEFPQQITIYRPPLGQFWAGKLAMIEAFRPHIRENCLLWQIDADEVWCPEQVLRLHRMFAVAPDRSAAYVLCRYFVGEDRVITSLDTYGNNRSYEWLRIWRYQPGDIWHSHEPPRLGRPQPDGSLFNVAALNPFTHEETAAAGLVFDHYAYTLEAQAQFKESYYGYSGAVEHWRRLQSHDIFPAYLRTFFPWVQDGAVVARCTDSGVVPLARRTDTGATRGDCFFSCPAAPELPSVPHFLRYNPRVWRVKRAEPVHRSAPNAPLLAHPLLAWLDPQWIDGVAFLALAPASAMLAVTDTLNQLRQHFAHARLGLFLPASAAGFWQDRIPGLSLLVGVPDAILAAPGGPELAPLLTEVRQRFTGLFDLLLNSAPAGTHPVADALAGACGAWLRLAPETVPVPPEAALPYTHLFPCTPPVAHVLDHTNPPKH